MRRASNEENVDAARRAGVLADSPRGRDWFTFTHPLLVEALAADVSLARRSRLHERIADAIESIAGDDPGRVIELAHHLLSASNRVDAERTERWTRRAAVQAEAQGAYAVAASLYRRLLAQRRSYAVTTGDTDASLQVALGRACNRAGDVPGAIEALLAARESAGPDTGALRAAATELGWEWSLQFSGWVDERVVSLVADALDSLGSRRTREWARIAGIRAEHLYYTDPDGADELVREALDVARAEADPVATAEALRQTSFAHACDADMSERVALLEESAQLLERGGEVLKAQATRVHEGAARLQMGDAAGFRSIADNVHRFAERYPSPRLRYFDATWHGMLAMRQRRDTEAERAIDTAALVRERNFPLSLDYPFFQRALLRHQQGRTDEIEEALAVAAQLVPIAAVQASHALAQATVGDHDPARHTALELCGSGLAAVPRDFNYVLTLAFLAETVHTIADRGLARQLLPHLTPYSGQVAVVGFGAATLGPVDGQLARLHDLVGDAAAAQQLRSAALELAVRLEDDVSVERIEHEATSQHTLHSGS